MYQDRFVKELRLAAISTFEAANEFFANDYLPTINARFARLPAQPEDGHVPPLAGTDLRNVFCQEETRAVSRDHVITFENPLYHVEKDQFPRPRPGERVTVRVWLDGSVHMCWNDKPLLVEEYNKPGQEDAPFSLSA